MVAFNNKLTYIKQAGESNGDAGDQYKGLDRFGRVVDQRWLTLDATPVTTDRFQYTYDADGNRTAKGNALHPAYDESYQYDFLNRLVDFQRADTHNQQWELDALGNMNTVTTDGTDQPGRAGIPARRAAGGA